MKLYDLRGKRFTRLLVVSLSAKRDGNEKWWHCICDCGKPTIVSTERLNSGNTRSCGCLLADTASVNHRTHGLRHTKEYTAWANMWRRCADVSRPEYKNYGGRGITVCERWRLFENFIVDMGPKPSIKHTLDRYPNNNGNYEPGNCRWATRTENNRNTRVVKMLMYGGVVKPLPQWAEELGLPKGTVQSRLRLGWSVEKTLSTPHVGRGFSFRYVTGH